MPIEEVLQTWYRSYTADGLVWCESGDLDDVKIMSEGKDVTYAKRVKKVVEGDWEPMSLEEVARAE